MNGLVFYIGLGLGLALAAGVRPFLPLLLAGALGSAKALGVTFTGDYSFMQSSWWLLAVVVALVLAYAAQMLLGLAPAVDPTERPGRADPLAASLTGISYGAGALLFAGTLASHHDAAWPGVLGGFAAVALVQHVLAPVAVRARDRLTDRAAREAVTLYADSIALVLAALVSLLHPLGYVALALLLWMSLRSRSRRAAKHAGLRILRR